MNDECILREKAQEAIRSGKLPTGRPDRTFGGPGSGIACAVCGERVMREQVELEIEFNRHGTTPGLDTYHLHPLCFAAWEFESHNLLTRGATSSSDQHDQPPPASMVGGRTGGVKLRRDREPPLLDATGQ